MNWIELELNDPVLFPDTNNVPWPKNYNQRFVKIQVTNPWQLDRLTLIREFLRPSPRAISGKNIQSTGTCTKLCNAALWIFFR